MQDPAHEHDPATRRPLVDARGIFCCYICDACEERARAKFRPDIFIDSQYWADEPIDEA